MDKMICPRCNQETNCLKGASNGYYDKVTKRFWGSSSIITNINNTVCETCFELICMQNKNYARKHFEFIDRHRDDALISALHSFSSVRGE